MPNVQRAPQSHQPANPQTSAAKPAQPAPAAPAAAAPPSPAIQDGKQLTPGVNNRSSIEPNVMSFQGRSGATTGVSGLVQDLGRFYVSSGSASGKIKATGLEGLNQALIGKLQDPEVRRALAEFTGINTPSNQQKLLLAMCVEADGGAHLRTEGVADNQRQAVRENVFPLGATLLNRYYSSVLVEATAYQAKHHSLQGFKPASFESMLLEPNQIAYATVPAGQRQRMMQTMQTSPFYAQQRQAAADLMAGNVSYEARQPNGKMRTVNAGAFYHYASPHDRVAVLNERQPGITPTPNGHRFGTYPPRNGSVQPFYPTGKANGRNISWNN